MTKRNDTLAVVVPTFNRAALLPDCIASIRAQGIVGVQILVVDDASSDETPAVLKRLGGPDLHSIRLLENRGAAAARNAGIEVATADWVAFLDVDDSWRPGGLAARLDAVAAAGDDVGIVYARSRRVDNGYAYLEPRPGQQPLAGDLSHALLRHNFVPTSTAIVRRRALAAIEGFEPTMRRAHDWDLWLRLAQRWRFLFVDQVVCDQPVLEDSISTDIDAYVECRTRLVERHVEAYRKCPRMQDQVLVDTAGRLCLAGRGRQARGLLRRVHRATLRRSLWWFISWLPMRLVRALRRLRRTMGQDYRRESSS